ncbi:hypothetical protein M9Y10_001667 [Tritrichomonas musculus]|uniref:GPI ethanolamine phosphate transferase 1 n=1 Tax=Tritrichomonas musculus TaxID=1915356 RepID=A0ABR2L7N6_9EUKA
MADLLNHPPKSRPFKEEEIHNKEKISKISLENDPLNYINFNTINNSYNPKKTPKYNMNLIHVNQSSLPSFFILLFIIVLSYFNYSFLFTLLSKSEDKNKKDFQFQPPFNGDFRLETLVYNSTVDFNSYLNLKLNIYNLTFASKIREKFHMETDFNMLSILSAIIFFYAFFKTLTFSNQNQFSGLIFTVLIFLSDKYLMNIFSPFTSFSLQIVIIFLSFYTFCSINFSQKEDCSLKKWFFIILFSMISSFFCIIMRIEYLAVYIPLFIIYMVMSFTQFSRFFLFVLAVVINFLFVIIADRSIGFAKITFDSFTLNDLLFSCLSSDSNGLFLTSILIIPFLWPFACFKSLKDYIYIMFISFIIILALKLPVSTIFGSFLTRIVIIRISLTLLLGRIVCYQESSTITIILFLLHFIVTSSFYIFDLDDIKLYNYFVNE